MNPRIISLLLILAGGLLLLVFWAASIGFVYWDVYRRDLPWRRQITWIGVTALLPLAGFFVYLLTRFVAPSFGRKKTEAAPVKKRETQPMPAAQQQVYLPTIGVDAGGEGGTAELGPDNSLRPARSARPHPVYFFSLVSGPDSRREFILQAFPAAIGRGPEAHICLDSDRSVSRRHAEVYARDGWLFIRDLESTHGTQVNGIWIADQRLEPGDEVQVGSSVLVFGVREGDRR
jgi:hypothetical protein